MYLIKVLLYILHVKIQFVIMFNITFCRNFLFLACIVISSCEDSIDLDYPTHVTHTYANKETTYDVILREYTLDANGDTLSMPVLKLWLDRNLGATQAAFLFNDTLAAGDLFQWGRSDDGHQRRMSDTTHIRAATILPGHDTYIVSPLGPADWLITPNDQLWNGANNTNCPCPSGWRLPTENEVAMEMHSWSSKNMEGAYTSPLKWVATGSRDNHGTLRYDEIWGFIWSSSLDADGRPIQLAIIASDTSELISSPRIFAASVRCIKDL